MIHLIKTLADRVAGKKMDILDRLSGLEKASRHKVDDHTSIYKSPSMFRVSYDRDNLHTFFQVNRAGVEVNVEIKVNGDWILHPIEDFTDGSEEGKFYIKGIKREQEIPYLADSLQAIVDILTDTIHNTGKYI